jgi:aminopeptidase N
MACYRVTLRANQQQYPTLLSNGNLVETGLLKEGRHYAIWVDPFKKPSYLFALVAGHLVSRERRITSLDGKDHTLQVYVRPGDLDKTEYAMQSLVRAIAWDEKRFHLPLDLERFMIVAVDDFNIGAMENKGLNLFNTQYILANPSTATDTDFANILSVVGHEYFHNWTGNRVTCRDWFELTLKEGLTVFRDQAFSQDMVGGCDARITTRIKDVLTLRQRQFAEDASPMAHPIRPESYVEINNFYTTTIYEKGAEVVRMMQTLTGEAGFIQGVTLYFERFDGQAVRCEDFVQAIADANPRSLLAKHLAIFKHWYSQAGTPHVEVCLAKDQGQTKLHFKQSYLPNPGQEGPAKQPVLIPIRLGLIETESGKVIDGVPEMFVLNQAEDELLLPELEKPVTPSLLRGFSAPVILDYPYKNTDLLSLLMYDTDPFNRWEAAQKLFLRYLLDAMTTPGDTPQSIFDQSILDVIQSTLKNVEIDPGLKALILSLPTESYITTQLKWLIQKTSVKYTNRQIKS